MTLASIGALLVAVTVAASSAVQVIEPEHSPESRAADMAEMGITSGNGYTECEYTHYDIPLSDEYQEYVTDVCEVYGLDPRIIFGIAYQESRFQADVTGDGGRAHGMYQVHPRWHSERMVKLGVTDLYDPYQAVWVCADFLAEVLNEYGSYEEALTYYRYGTLTATGEPYADIVMTQAYSFPER